MALSAVPASADLAWRVNKEADEAKGLHAGSPYVENAEGHRLSLFKATTGAIWASFQLSKKSFDKFGSLLPAYRIDGGDVKDIEDSRRMQEIYQRIRRSDGFFYFIEPKSVEWLLLAPENTSVEAKTGIGQFMVGNEILFRYKTDAGEQRETKFSLMGVTAAIRAAFEIELAP